MKIQEADYGEVLKLRQEVLYPLENIELAKVEDDDKGIHLGVFVDDTLVSCVSIYLKDRCLQFRKMATKADYRNRGYATELIKYIVEYHKSFEFDKLWANARREALPFYEKLGFNQTDDTFTKNGREYVVVEYAVSAE